ncbi:hypothetical protein SUZIE_183145, partial [Sciurus carolinensis]|nr:hypothetical protein [Sciurus carolinensis]
AQWVGTTEHRRAVYSRSVSTKRLDTMQMAMIRYTLTSTRAFESAVPAGPCQGAFGPCLFSTRDTSTVVVVVSAD